ncbi:MAG: hypothetical protein AAB221_03170, partial [Bacteroidota bacterium]
MKNVRVKKCIVVYTFVGNLTGSNIFNTGGSNTFVGQGSGFSNTTGSESIFAGASSGYYNTTGGGNSFFGVLAGRDNTVGNGNVFVGSGAGLFNATGGNNTYIGGGAGSPFLTTNLNNASAFGSNAIVTSDNQMILGNNAVNVGIGLSDITPGPQNKLEINAIDLGGPGNIDD